MEFPVKPWFPATLSVVVPCYRSGAWTDELVERIDRATSDLKGRRELILVDDASPDTTTWPAIERAAAERDWVRALRLQFNVGQFRATLAGIERATGDYVATLDDDLQTPPEELHRLMRAAVEHPEMDVVIGAYTTKQHSRLRNLGSRFVSWLYRRLFGKAAGFQTTSFRLMKRSLASVLCAHRTLRPQLGALILQSTQPGHRMNVRVEHHARAAGESGYGWGTLVHLALDNVFQTSVAPLRAMSMAGLSVALGAFVLSLFYLVRWSLGYIREPGFTTLVLLMTFVAGMMLLSIGIVGEYVQRVVAEVTGQPRYVVREEVEGAIAAQDAAPATARPRLLMLGASALQRPVVQRAVEMGIEVVTADNVPSNPAHEWSHEQLDISTRDAAALIDAARRLRIGAVMTAASDLAVPSVAAVARALGLPDATGTAARDWTDKERFRAFQARAGLRHPEGLVCTSAAAIASETLPSLRLVVKPVDRSGSRGVCVVDAADLRAVADAVQAAVDVSFAGRARIEALIEGEEFGGDGVVRGGQLERFFLTRKRMQGCAVRGHTLPAEVSPALEARIVGELQAHILAAGFTGGVLNADIRVGGDGVPVVLEMSPRMGGNGIRELVRHATGFDLARHAVDVALGREADARIPRGPVRRAAVHTIASLVPGRVARLPVLADAQARIPELVSIEFDVAVGDDVHPFRDSADQVGRALTEGGDPAQLAAALDRLFTEAVVP